MLKISHPTGIIRGKISIGGSKSETNRLLILQDLSAHAFDISNASDSDDSKVLRSALASTSQVIDCQMAGTAFRFLTAYFAQKQGREVILTGSERMKKRPIEPLVEALKSIGADIEYLGEIGFPPLKIKGKKLLDSEVEISASISSQFITALMLIAPTLPNGLTIHLKGYATSLPYLYLTSSLMQHLGYRVVMEMGKITLYPGAPCRSKVFVEPDWSSASYLFSMALLSKEAELYLPALRYPSMQGDSNMVGYLSAFGLEPVYIGSGYRIGKKEELKKLDVPLHFNLGGTPDLAQTLAVLLAALDIPARLEGLSTLKIKETDRIVALQNELQRLGAHLLCGDDFIEIKKGIPSKQKNLTHIRTYNDHRMAMAFAPLALLFPIVIQNPKVVSKSYPNFWEHLIQLGFQLEEMDV